MIDELEKLRKENKALRYAMLDVIKQLHINIDKHEDITLSIPKANGYRDDFVLWLNEHNEEAKRAYKSLRRFFDLLAK